MSLLGAASVLLLATPARADCAAPVSLAALEARLAAADTAYGHDQDAFRSASSGARLDSACLVEVVAPATAARLHRTVGMLAYVDRDPARAVAAFASARAADPGCTFPEGVVPPGNLLLADYSALDPSRSTSVSIAIPPGWRVVVDGQLAEARAADRPAFVQAVGPGDAIHRAYLDAGAELPPELLPAVPAPAPRRSRGPLLATGSGVAAVAAGVLYGVAVTLATDYRNNAHSDSELLELRERANVLTAVSGAVGGLALGLGVGAALVVPW